MDRPNSTGSPSVSRIKLFYRCVMLLSAATTALLFVLFIRTLDVASSRVGDSSPCSHSSRSSLESTGGMGARKTIVPFEGAFIPADSAVIERFTKALTFRTISYGHGKSELEELSNLGDFIIRSFPTVHESPLVRWQRVANYSLLYRVQGSNSTLQPYLLMAHLDVVPADSADWDVPPFDGIIRDEYIYGRGAIDAKHIVFGILEALEFALKQGHKPKRSFYVAFGHDEEVHGVDGAANIAKLLKQENVHLQFILDEGTMIVQNVIRGIDQPVAVIGTSEKGSAMVELSVSVEGGHSSLPESQSSIGILARAITSLEDNPQPSMFGTGPEKAFLEALAPHMSFGYRLVLSNLWLFSPIVVRIMSRDPVMNALMRTTTAVTMFNAGVKENVIAPSAVAIVNHRIHPSQTVEEVLAYDRKVVNDERVNIKLRSGMEPHPKSSYAEDCFGYQTIKTSVLQMFSDIGVIVVPGLLVANTDSFHYLSLADDVYRFSPPRVMSRADLKRFHGVNERISVENYEQTVNFYYHVILNADRETLPTTHKHSEL